MGQGPVQILCSDNRGKDKQNGRLFPVMGHGFMMVIWYSRKSVNCTIKTDKTVYDMKSIMSSNVQFMVIKEVR